MGVEIFDERICVLGESPVAFGKSNSEISWVDILGSRVLTRNLITGEVGAFSTAENVGFALRRVDGGYLLGTNSGPILRDTDGSLHTLFSLQEVDPQTRFHSVRWNDAKIAPNGDLFLGTMAYSMLPETSTLFSVFTH
jgi:sugar lactone lactonase YvrE